MLLTALEQMTARNRGISAIYLLIFVTQLSPGIAICLKCARLRGLASSLVPPFIREMQNGTGDEASQLAGLQKLYNATNIIKSHELRDWFTHSDYCRFTGITCDDRTRRITQIRLEKAGLSGSLPETLSEVIALL